MMRLTCTSFCTTETIRPRKRRTIATIFNGNILHVFLLYFLLFGTSLFVHSAAWTNGPSDSFFCGYKWDDPDCDKRQHCPTGESTECEGESEGVKCYANTNCDTRYGHGDSFVTGEPPKESPGGTSRPTYGGKSEDETDHFWCGVSLDDARNKCGTQETHCPSGSSSDCPQGRICFPGVFTCDARNLIPPTASPITDSPTRAPAVAGPSKFPTYSPIGPPDPLPFPSQDLTDHWFCGIGIDDANDKCRVHCPTASECPMGNICYFGTQCDSRTHSPTPPPTRRPTTSPVPFPTVSPTFTMLPTSSPTFTTLPTDAPSEQGPTQSPTPSPTKRPTFPPMPTLQATFFCGTNWDDAITNCKRRCPTGESTECPFDEKCFSGTPCTEELGYPEDYGLAGGGDGSSGSEGGEACVPFKVTIVADHWPKETSWLVENTELGDIIAEGNNKDLIPGEPVEWVECVNNRNGCYEFTINDSGGDGMCCEHGNGSYKISYDGVELKQGSTFYDLEKTPFGFCGAPDTEQPTKKPTEAPQKNPASGGTTISGGGGKSGDAAYRCVPNPLAESGYEVSSDKCNLFVDCYNQYIDVGDDFFCDENSSCIDAPGCFKEDNPAEAATAPPPAVSSPQTNPPTSKVSASRPIVARPKPASKPASKPAPEISKTKSTPPTPSPVAVAVDSPTESPTLLPTTYRPTYGPCGGEMCNEEDHCRSRYGFCGPGDTYCNDDAIWTNDCPVPEPSPRPSPLPVSESPTNPPVTLAPVTLIPTASIPVSGLDDLIEATESPTAHPVTTMRPSPKKTSSGFKKPGGGKGSLSKPAKSHSPITLYPTRKPTPLPTDVIVTTSGSTVNPSSSPITMIGTVVLDSLTTASPSPLPTRPPSNRPTEAPFREPITPAPTHKAILKPTISLSEPDVDSSPSETQPEVDTTKTKPGVDTSGTNNVPSTVSDTSSKADEDEYDCAGEQCPVDTHCRSRYGSCGPGFIYCNLYSIWRNTCPPIVPGTRPTRTPTAKPTKSPESNRFEPSFTSTLVVPESSTPTFPPLPKPSLPTIGSKQVTPLTPPSSFSDTDEGAESDQAENHITEGAKSDQAKHNDTDKPEPSASPNSNPSAELFQSAGYLHEWKSGHSNCAPPYTLLHPSYLMLLVLSLSCSLLYSILV